MVGTLLAICMLGAALFIACALAVKLTKEDEALASSSLNKTTSSEEKAEEEKELEHFFFPNYPYMYGGGVWGDPFSPFNVL